MINQDNINIDNNINDDITINLKNIFLAIWNRKFLIATIFIVVLAFFIILTFISEKKWTVSADLYINKTNNSNFTEVNPYVINEMGGLGSILGNNDPLANELELIKSPKVIDNVIKENDLKFKKLFNIITTAKSGEYWTTEKFLKKKVSFENKKGTNILAISYTSKDRDEAYNVVNSIIKNYIALHQEINSAKAKSDKEIIEEEYRKAKAELDRNVNSASGLPMNSFAGAGNLAAMSAVSRSSRNALANMKGQYVAGEKSRIAVSESTAKVTQLAQRLEWANLVDEMSDSSKVLVIKEPYQLRDWEYSSPKLLTNIILGIIFGVIGALLGVIIAELRDKKLAYSMLGDEIIYDAEKDLCGIKKILLANNDKKILIITFDNIPNVITAELQKYRNINIIKADLSEDFITGISNAEEAILFVSVGKTDSKFYKTIKEILSDKNKQIISEVLV